MSSNTSVSPAGTPAPSSPAKSRATPRKTLKMARANPFGSKPKRVPAVKAKSAPKAVAGAHPSWKDIISECIVNNKDDARMGVSRSTIKKFAEELYGLDTSGGNIYQLNRAIASGVEGGLFVLPKGPSGKVKLAPKAKSAAKENSKPAPVSKSKAVSKPAPASKVKATTKPVKAKAATKPAPTSKAAAKPVSKPKPKSMTTAAAKPKSKAVAVKAKVAPKKVLAGKAKAKEPKTGATKKTSTSKRGSAKASVTGTTKAKEAAARKTPAKKAATRGRK